MAAAAVALASCTKEAIDPLSGVFEKPEDVHMTQVLSYPVEKLGNLRCFNVELATEGVTGTEGNYSGTGSVLSLKLYGNKFFLDNATYTAAAADAVKSGFYLVGEGGSTFTRVNSGKSETVRIDHGGISVSSENGAYSFTGSIWLADSKVIKLDSKAVLTYEPDPEPVSLVKVLSAQSNVANGQPTLTMQLATEDVSSTFDPSTWQTTYSGDGNYLALDIYSADGYLHEGTYKACAVGGQVGESEFGIGYDTEFWGQQMYNWGTCWWTVANGATSAQKILSGTVTVSRKGSRWTIELQSGEGKDMIWCLFNGEIPALTDPGSSSEITYEELSNVLTAQSNVANGTKSVSLNIGTDGVTVEGGQFGNTFKGNGNYLALDVYSEDGKLAPGTYKANATGGQIAAGEFGIGWDPGDIWGMGIEFTNWGTCWWTVENDVTSAEKVLDGTLVVSVEGDVYTITLESEAVNARYVGPVAL